LIDETVDELWLISSGRESSLLQELKLHGHCCIVWGSRGKTFSKYHPVEAHEEKERVKPFADCAEVKMSTLPSFFCLK